MENGQCGFSYTWWPPLTLTQYTNTHEKKKRLMKIPSMVKNAAGSTAIVPILVIEKHPSEGTEEGNATSPQ